jgi:hypothetical protein
MIVIPSRYYDRTDNALRVVSSFSREALQAWRQ